MAKKEDGVSYIRVDSPVDARKEVLSAAIEATYILKHIERYKTLEVKKDEKIKEINRLMKKINSEALVLKRSLPKDDDLKTLKKSEPRMKVEKETKKERVKVDPLERDLADIKSKLDSIKL